jgi:flagellar biosynthesis protein FlhF
MQLRTFIAKDMREALGQVRSEMGPDAVIVASQRAKGGGVMVRAAFDAPVANGNDEIEFAATAPGPAVALIESVQDYAQNYHDGLIRRLRGATESAVPTSLGFNRAELLTLLRGHRAPEGLAHHLAEIAEKNGLGDMTLALASALDRRMRTAPIDAAASSAFLLLGPSGAGKTAVAAKIAAHARLAGRTVKLVAADTIGAGAVARLEAFGEHLGVATALADSAEEVAAAVKDGDDSNILTIIDTAGFDPRNARARTAYSALAQVPHVEALGVVSASADSEEIAEVAAALVTLGVKRIIATGLDVTRRLGALLAAATQGAALAHVTRSPFIAGGLETLTPLSLSRLLIEARAGSADRGSTQ